MLMSDERGGRSPESVIRDRDSLLLAAVLCTLMVRIKGALRLGDRSAVIVGDGMVPRGEVGIVVATLGRGAGVIPDGLFGVLVAMSLLTSMLAPPLLKVLLAGGPPPPPGSDEDPGLIRVEETGHDA